MSVTIPNFYRPATQEEFDEFVGFADSTGTQWRTAYHSHDGKITVWDQKSDTSAVNIVKLVARLPELEALTLYDVLHDPDYRKEWDDNMVEGYLIEQLDANNDVGYYSAKSPVALVSPRDFVNERSWRVKDEGKEYVIMNHSVVHPKMPETKKFVRANSIKTGYLVRPHSEGGCVLTYITQTDVRGWIPTSLMNTLTTKFAPKLIERLERVGKGYHAWKSEHNPNSFPWRGVGSY